MINELKVFLPAHITGFFEIIENENPVLKGSRGAGITLDEGVITHTKVSYGSGNIKVLVNGCENKLNCVSTTAIDVICELYNVDLSCYDIFIEHTHTFDVGAGFGTSAGFALGVSFTLPKLLGIDISYNMAGEIAHLTELRLSSGLGDVIATMSGGCVMRMKEGSPRFGIIDKIPITQPIYVICKTLGCLDTGGIIDDPIHQMKINSSGSNLLKELMKNPSINNFIKLSYEFAKNTNLISDELSEIIDVMKDETLGASMAMLGNTAFALSKTPDISVDDCIITKINTTGVKYITKKIE